MKFAAFLALLTGLSACGEKAAPPSPPPSAERSAALTELAAGYERELRPLFQAKCNDCHGRAASMPGYYRIPGVKQYIDWDIREAREELDSRGGFPFGGKNSVEGTLADLQEVARERDMPPLLYRLAHRGSALTPEEARALELWARRAQERLAAPGKASSR